MRIVAINGSHQGDHGYTRFLIDRLFDGATAAGAECEVVSLAGIKMLRCLGCQRCHTPEHALRCVYDDRDEVRGVFEMMAAADLLVYATPVQVFAMSGLMKTFLDRLNATGDTHDMRLTESGLLFHHVDRAICSKPFVTLVCCDNVEADTPRNVLAYFRTFARFMDAPQVGELVRNAGRLAGHGQDPADERLASRVHDVYAAYAQAGRELATEGTIRAATQRRANCELVPVPFFGVLKRLPIKPLKRRFVARAQAINL